MNLRVRFGIILNGSDVTWWCRISPTPTGPDLGLPKDTYYGEGKTLDKAVAAAISNLQAGVHE